MAVGAALSGVYVYHLQNGPVAPKANAVETLFASNFTELDGKKADFAQWKGKVLVVNFWATWCPPCRKEIPEFIKMQQKYKDKGLQFIGIAIDQVDKVQAYSDEMGFNYPILIGELEAAEMARQLGNRLGGLPFTVIIDRNGKVVTTELGGLTEAKLESIVTPIL